MKKDKEEKTTLKIKDWEKVWEKYWNKSVKTSYELPDTED